MWLQVTKRYGMSEHDPATLIVPIRVDVMQEVEDAGNEDKPIVVGTLLADELRMATITEIDEDAWDVADADSSGLEAAYAAVLDEDGAARSAITDCFPTFSQIALDFKS